MKHQSFTSIKELIWRDTQNIAGRIFLSSHVAFIVCDIQIFD